MEENEDEPEDVRKARPVEEEIKKGEIDEHSARPTQPFENSTRKRNRCEKNYSKKKPVKSEGECCRARLAKVARAPKTATVLIYEKKCALSKIKVIPRHCLSKDEWIDILATPSRKCPPPCLQRAVTRRIRPVSARMAELAQPPKQRLLNTLQNRGGTLPTELVDNLIQTLEGETCLTPEQAEKMFRDKDIRSKKKCRKKKSKNKCKSGKLDKHAEPGIAGNMSSFDKDAVHCQYLMADSFVKSILDWKCPIPREEFKDIADVILKRLGYILEYSPLNGEDRKSQQMRFLSDIIASWISGVLFEVAEARRTELEEDCERRRKEKEEEAEEESDDDTEEESDDDDEDDDDDKKRPKGRGGPPRKGEDDKPRKGGKEGKDDDEDKKHGKPGKKEDTKETLETGEVKDPAEKVTEESPSKPAAQDQKSPVVTTQLPENERESKEEEIFHDARVELGSLSDVDEKKTSMMLPEDMKFEDKTKEEGVQQDTKPEEKMKEEMVQQDTKPDEKMKEEMVQQDTKPEEKTKEEMVQQNTKSEEKTKEEMVQQHPKPVDPLAKVEVVTSIANEDVPFQDLREGALESEQSPDLVKGESEIGKRDDDVTLKKSVEASRDEKKTEDAFVDYSQPLAKVKESIVRKPTEMEKAAVPIATTASPEDSATAKTTKVGESEKEANATIPTDKRAAGEKIDDREMAARRTKIPEASLILEAKKEEDTGVSNVAVDSGNAGAQAQKDLTLVPPTQDSSIPIVGEGASKREEESQNKEMEMKKDDEPKMKTTAELSQDPSTLVPAKKSKAEETELKEGDGLKKHVEAFKDPSTLVTAEDLEEIETAFTEDDEPKKIVEPSLDPSRLARGEKLKEAEMYLTEDDGPKKVIDPSIDPSKLATTEKLKDPKTEQKEDDEPKKIVEPSEDPSSLVTIEALKDKRKESSKKISSKKPSSSTALIGKKYETDVPFVTFDKIFHTIYNAIEASNENNGNDSITNRIHRAVYEKFSNVVQEENPGPLPELTKDVLDVMSGKIALWLRNVLTDSQLSFMNKFPATVESVDVREWSKWIGYVSDTANTWSAWIQQTIRQAEDMRSSKVTRGDWRDWTKSVETDALRWRRFYLESQHQAHQNLTMIRDRHVVKTGSRRIAEQKEEYEEEMKITDLEVER